MNGLVTGANGFISQPGFMQKDVGSEWVPGTGNCQGYNSNAQMTVLPSGVEGALVGKKETREPEARSRNSESFNCRYWTAECGFY